MDAKRFYHSFMLFTSIALIGTLVVCQQTLSPPMDIQHFQNGKSCLEQFLSTEPEQTTQRTDYLKCSLNNFNKVMLYRFLNSPSKGYSPGILFYYLGISYYYRGVAYYDTAYLFFQASMQSNQANTDEWQSIGNLDTLIGSFDEYMSMICSELERYNEAVIYLKRWLERYPSTVGYLQLAKIFCYQDKFADAKIYLQRILESEKHPEMLQKVYKLYLWMYDRYADPGYRKSHQNIESLDRSIVIETLEKIIKYTIDPDEKEELLSRLNYEKGRMMELSIAQTKNQEQQEDRLSQAIELYKEAYCLGYQQASAALNRNGVAIEKIECR